MDTEAAYLKVLPTAASYTIDAGKLTLLAADGTIVAVYATTGPVATARRSGRDCLDSSPMAGPMLIPTLRDDPADAVAVSHRLLVRAGAVRQIGAGMWTWLPLGWRSLQARAGDHPRGDGRASAARRC